MYSVNFEEFNPRVDPNEWEELTEKFLTIAQTLESAGADGFAFCANTPHIIADKIQNNISIPLINIATETSKEIAKNKVAKVGLLGTRITMEQSFYKDKLADVGITTITPALPVREFIHYTILKKMAKDIFKAETKERFLQIINQMNEQGAEGIVLACTEIPILIKQEDCRLPLFDTTLLHAKAIVDFMLR